MLKLLSDPTRVRLLALLRSEELSVGELGEILDMAQSRISSQLAQLRTHELVQDRREGKKAFYTLNPRIASPAQTLLEAACEAVDHEPELQSDQAHLARVIQKRRSHQEQYFNLIAGKLGRNYCPGRSWEAIGHLALRLAPQIEVADLGAGEGLISQLLARRVARVWCIDNSSRMVEVGTELAKKNGLENLAYKLGDIENVPLPDASVDLAILSQALHHAQHPPAAVGEAFRILRPGGQLLLLDLKAHQFEKARELYADVWLGFSKNELHEMTRAAGFDQVEVTTVSREAQEPFFETLLASGVRPSA
jgi:SAM-dependent methyltransferase